MCACAFLRHGTEHAVLHEMRPFSVGQQHAPKCMHRLRARATARGTSTDDFVTLGASDLQVSAVGVGTLAWGDPSKGWGERFTESDVKDICAAASAAGINFYDTAEVYGYQNAEAGSSSECLVARCAEGSGDRPRVVASKYFTIPWTNFLLGGGFRFGQQSLADALDATLQRLGTNQIDLYQIHFPFPSYSQDVLMAGLRDAVESGKARAVAVCNYNAAQLEEAHALLSKHGIPLASNQIEYSLLNRGAERDGVLQKCGELGVTPIAHSPLRQGLLTDFALERGDAQATKIRPLLQLLQLIGAISGGKAIEQVSLNYLMSRGAVVIPGAKSVAQLERNAGALGWRLDDNEVEMISEKLDAMRL